MEHSPPTRPPWISRRVGYFLTVTRPGRKLTILTHGRLYHRGWRHPLRTASDGCWFCRLVWREIMATEPPLMDRSSIQISEPVYDADGKLVKAGMSMSATAKRQIDALMAKDPSLAAKLNEALDEIARDPKP